MKIETGDWILNTKTETMKLKMKDESKNNGGKKHVSLNAYLGHSETFCRDSWLCNKLCG